MCLFRQCRNREAVELDVIAKFVRKDYFSVEFGSHLMEFTYDHNIGMVYTIEYSSTNTAWHNQ